MHSHRHQEPRFSSFYSHLLKLGVAVLSPPTVPYTLPDNLYEYSTGTTKDAGTTSCWYTYRKLLYALGPEILQTLKQKVSLRTGCADVPLFTFHYSQSLATQVSKSASLLDESATGAKAGTICVANHSTPRVCFQRKGRCSRPSGQGSVFSLRGAVDRNRFSRPNQSTVVSYVYSLLLLRGTRKGDYLRRRKKCSLPCVRSCVRSFVRSFWAEKRVPYRSEWTFEGT